MQLFLRDDPERYRARGRSGAGATMPGSTVVCGDSHTSTHGALATLAFGIGTSEVEHVLATQCLLVKKNRNMRVEVRGQVGPGVTAKDIALAIIGEIGTAGGTGYAIEYCGEAVEALSMEGRMTLSNLTIEGGARTGLVAVDDVTINYMRGRPFAPKGEMWDAAVEAWRELKRMKMPCLTLKLCSRLNLSFPR